MYRNNNTRAASYFNPEKGAEDFKLLEFIWSEQTPSSPEGHQVRCTRTEVQIAFSKLIARTNRTWHIINLLKRLLHRLPLRKRLSQEWMDAARDAAEVATLFRKQYRDLGASGVDLANPSTICNRGASPCRL